MNKNSLKVPVLLRIYFNGINDDHYLEKKTTLKLTIIHLEDLLKGFFIDIDTLPNIPFGYDDFSAINRNGESRKKYLWLSSKMGITPDTIRKLKRKGWKLFNN